MEQKGFSDAETKCRKLMERLASIQDLGIQGLRFNPDPYGQLDAAAYVKGYPTVIELKLRNVSIDKYDSWLLEKSKYDAMVWYQLESNTRSLYINFFPTSTGLYDAIMFDMTSRINAWGLTGGGEFSDDVMPTTTMGNNKLTQKLVTYLEVKRYDKVVKGFELSLC